MRKSATLLRGGVSEREATRIITLLAAMGIEAEIAGDGYDRLDVYVMPASLEAATQLLVEEAAALQAADRDASRNPEESRFGRSSAGAAGDELIAPAAWFGRGAVAVLGLMAMCVATFVAANIGEDAGSRSRLLELGAISYSQVRAGEHWRFLTAIFLHFDIAHLLANMSVMLIVGPPLAHQIGAWRFVLIFLVSGFGGNVISQVFNPLVGLKAGASGAIAGLLGALGGYALRAPEQSRYRSWQRLGALAAIYGLLIGFGPGRDNVAHVGGLLVGFVLGWWTSGASEANRARISRSSL